MYGDRHRWRSTKMIIIIIWYWRFCFSIFSLFFFFFFSSYVLCHGPKAFPVVTSVGRERTDGRKKKYKIKYPNNFVGHAHPLHTTYNTHTQAVCFVPTVFAARRLPVVSLSIGPKRVSHTHTHYIYSIILYAAVCTRIYILYCTVCACVDTSTRSLPPPLVPPTPPPQPPDGRTYNVISRRNYQTEPLFSRCRTCV